MCALAGLETTVIPLALLASTNQASLAGVSAGDKGYLATPAMYCTSSALILLFCLYSSLTTQDDDFDPKMLIDDSVTEGETFLTPTDFGALPIPTPSRYQLSAAIEHVRGRPGPLPNDPTMGNKFEGDIVNIDNVQQFVAEANGHAVARNAIRSRWRLWPQGEIPYTLSTLYGTYSRHMIASAMDEYHRKTCIKFVPRNISKHRDYVHIWPDDGCYSLVGRAGGKQSLSLTVDCLKEGVIVHELMHTVGFFHEQSRSDRDNYVLIKLENVDRNAQDQFEKYSLNTIQTLGEPYDYASIMHYGPYAFSASGKQTIFPLQNRAYAMRIMGQRDGFSEIDLNKINKLYDCPVKKPDDDNAVTSSTIATSTDTAPVVTSTPECVDQSGCWLKRWYRRCEDADGILREQCPRYCNSCPKATTTTTITTTTTHAPTAGISSVTVCRDNNPQCSSWKRFCDVYTEFMSSTCSVTCGTCVDGDALPTSREISPSCIDHEDESICRFAAAFYSCDTTAFMRKRCRKTCNLC